MKYRDNLVFAASRFDGVFCFGSSIIVKNEFLEASWEGLKDKQYVEILASILADITAKRQTAINATKQGNFAAAIQCRRPNYRMPHLLEYAKYHDIPAVRIWEVARDTWLNQTTVSSVVSEWEQFFALDLPEAECFMASSELKRLQQFPNQLKIYRAYDGSLGRSYGRNSLSWTLSKMVASQFAYNTKRIAQAEVNKSDVVVGYISERGQHEIVVRSLACIRHLRAVNSIRGSNAMRG